VVLAPEGRRLLRLEARNSQTPIERKPPWIKTRLRTGPEYTELKSLVRRQGLHTVCEEAGCPNIFECWEDREATFLVGGDTCTRRCDFCQIASGKPEPLDTDEPRRVAASVAAMGLRYATVTGVARDDLPDGGAWLYAQTCVEIHAAVPGCGVELLIPDFNADPARLGEVFAARPEVLAHNIETVPRIFRRIRPGFRYGRSLEVLAEARAAGLVTKSNLILGLGEEPAEISQAMADLRAAGCELLTITQYLRPSPLHHPVVRWVEPAEFERLREEALGLGFAGVMSGPLVRSSYRAGRLHAEAMARRTAADSAPAGAPAQSASHHAAVSRIRPAARILPSMANKPAGAATPKDAADPASAGRIKQIRMVAGIIRKQNPRALPIVVLAGIGVLAVFVIVGIFTHLLAFLLPLGLASGLLVSMIIFGRYAQSAQYAAVEGQPGAAAAIMQSMRGGWTVTPAVSANRNMDVVHRAVGKPGVVLVGEGSPNRLGSLLAAEKKRVSRVAFDVPIYDLQVGNEEGQIPIRKLQRKMMRLPRNLKGPAVADLNFRLKALPQSLQAPKGPMPRTGRMPKPPRPRYR